MSDFDPLYDHQEALRRAASTGVPQFVRVQEFTTNNGVKVVVEDRVKPPPRRPEPRPEPVYVFPPDQPVQDRAAFMESLFRQHGEFILDRLLHRRDVKPASAEDLRSVVIDKVCDYAVKVHPPRNVRGFLEQTIQNEVSNHKRNGRTKADPDADVEDMTTSAPDPEQAAQMAEHKAKLLVYIDRLPPDLAQVIRCLDLAELSYEQTAQALGKPLGTISTLHTRALRALEEIRQESERAADRRRPRR